MYLLYSKTDNTEVIINIMKRIISIILVFLLLATVVTGCTQTANQDNASAEKKLSVVCTIFPQYDWAREILGSKADNIDLTLLMDSGVDLHNYQPSVDDIVKISTCDLFIYVGGESDEWVDAVLTEASNPNMIVINLLDALGDSVKTEEIIEGMEEDHDHDDHKDDDHKDDDNDDGHDHDHAEEAVYDEHVWLSLKNAEVFCSVIADALSLLDAGNAGEYERNLASYTEKLSALDAEYQTAVNAASVGTLLFGDRFPFRYFADSYGLSYHAAFPGCSAETEASFETVIFLAGKADELGLHTIMVTESTDQSIAKTIINNTTDKNQQILALDSMQSVKASDVNSGTTYLSIMESNLNVLKEALK